MTHEAPNALKPPEHALAELWNALDGAPTARSTEAVDLLNARGRVLAHDVASPHPIPEFRRSMMDGYALRAADCVPGRRLSVVGEVAMGEGAPGAVSAGHALKIHTGGPVPDGAEVVLPHENALRDGDWIEVGSALAAGDNVIAIGEDVRAGERVMQAGTILREAEIAGLASLGHAHITVRGRLRVALISSGDELVPITAMPRLGQVRASNGVMLAARLSAIGAQVNDLGVVADDSGAFADAARRARASGADAIVFIAGSSASERDHAPATIRAMGAPGILTHGVAFRPGKPLILALCDGIPVFGLPGNPISALMTAQRFLVPTLWHMLGARAPRPGTLRGHLVRGVRSPAALEHWIPARIEGDEVTAIVTKSNLIFNAVRAEGAFCVPIGVDRLEAGSMVEIVPFFPQA